MNIFNKLFDILYIGDSMEKPRLKIYFIHSQNEEVNENIYLPVLRSEQLSHDELLFSMS